MKDLTTVIIHLITIVFLGKTKGYDIRPILIMDETMDTMIELTTKQPYCHIKTNKDRIKIDIRIADVSKVKTVSQEEFKKFVDICQKKVNNSDLQNSFSFPGTKWCGPGDTARSGTDLGLFSKEDECCREHDACSRYIYAGDCRGGVCNNTPYTRSHCDCDDNFKTCLQGLRSPVANLIGEVFFNIVGIVCFKELPPCEEVYSKTRKNLTEEHIKSYFNIDESTCKLEFSQASRYQPSTSTRNSIILAIKRKHMLIVQTLFRKIN